MPRPPIASNDAAACDLGLTHIALSVRDVSASIDFYERYAAMRIVHRRESKGRPIVWLSDLSRPFVLVLMQKEAVCGRLNGVAHLGVACASRERIDGLCEQARREGVLELGPEDAGAPVGYFALLRDPDGHNLEIAYGQEVGLAVAIAAAKREPITDRPPARAPCDA